MYKYSVVGSPGDAWFEHYIMLFAEQKNRRVLVIFSYMSDGNGRKSLIVRGCIGPRGAKEPRYQKLTTDSQLADCESYIPSIENVVNRIIHKVQPVSHTRTFAIFRLLYVHIMKDTRLSSLFHTASDRKLAGAWEQGYGFM